MRLSHFLYYLLLLCIPIQLGRHFWPSFSFVNGARIDYLAPTVYLFDVFLATMLFVWLIEKRKSIVIFITRAVSKSMSCQSLIYFVLILILVSIGNILFASFPILALLKFTRITFYSLLILFMYYEKPSLKFSLYILLSAGLFTAAIAWIQFILQHSLGGLLWIVGERTFSVATPNIATMYLQGRLFFRPYATFPHPNALAGFFTILLFYTLYVINYRSKSIILYFVISVFISIPIITVSKNSWITITFLSLLCFLYYFRHNNKTMYRLSGLLSIFFLIIITTSIFMTSFWHVANESVVLRIHGAQQALFLWKTQPMWGIGMNNYLPLLATISMNTTFITLQPVHSAYLLSLTETGIFGISVLILLICLFLRFIKVRFRAFPFLVLMPVLAVILLSLFDHYFYTLPQMQLLVFFCIGMIVLSGNNVQKKL